MLEGDPIRNQGAFLDLLTGEVIPSFTTDFIAADGEGSATMLLSRIAGCSCPASVPEQRDRTWRISRP